MPISLRTLPQLMPSRIFVCPNLGKIIETSTARMAMTTTISMNVNADISRIAFCFIQPPRGSQTHVAAEGKAKKECGKKRSGGVMGRSNASLLDGRARLCRAVTSSKEIEFRLEIGRAHV